MFSIPLWQWAAIFILVPQRRWHGTISMSPVFLHDEEALTLSFFVCVCVYLCVSGCLGVCLVCLDVSVYICLIRLQVHWADSLRQSSKSEQTQKQNPGFSNINHTYSSSVSTDEFYDSWPGHLLPSGNVKALWVLKICCFLRNGHTGPQEMPSFPPGSLHPKFSVWHKWKVIPTMLL